MLSSVPFSDRISNINAIFHHFYSMTFGSCSYLRFEKETDAVSDPSRWRRRWFYESTHRFSSHRTYIQCKTHPNRPRIDIHLAFVDTSDAIHSSISSQTGFSLTFDAVGQLIWSSRTSRTHMRSLLDTYSNFNTLVAHMRHVMSSCQSGILPITHGETVTKKKNRECFQLLLEIENI